jgi:uracil-DNA glycosylase family 4
MGVDFVPVFRTGGADGGPGTAEPSIFSGPPESEAPVVVTVRQPERVVETKPVPQGAAPEAPLVGREAKQAALDELRARYERDCPHKDFVTEFNNIVFGEGDPGARLLFIGEAPGEEEDRTGRPFVGRAGQLLTKMITAMGLTREQVYICNVLKTRPLNNATPTPREVEICSPYLYEQVGIIGPEAIVTLGLPATRAVLKVEGSMGSLRAKWSNMRLPDGRKIPVMPTYHPSFVLRSYTAENRGKVWSDLQMVLEKLGLKTSAKPPT